MEARYNTDGFVVVDYDYGDELVEIVLYQATRAIEDLVNSLQYNSFDEGERRYMIDEAFDNLEQDEQDMIGLGEFTRLVYDKMYFTSRFTNWDLRDSGEGM